MGCSKVTCGSLTKTAFLSYLLQVEAGLLVVVRCLAPGAAQRNNLLGTERKFGLE
jgi:hypothetical protein